MLIFSTFNIMGNKLQELFIWVSRSKLPTCLVSFEPTNLFFYVHLFPTLFPLTVLWVWPFHICHLMSKDEVKISWWFNWPMKCTLFIIIDIVSVSLYLKQFATAIHVYHIIINENTAHVWYEASLLNVELCTTKVLSCIL